MIRPFTIITMMLAALSGAYLFMVKHQAQVLDDQITAYGQSSRLDAMRIRVLQGQWSLETDPTRLQQLAAQFTALQPMQPAQLVTLAGLRAGLPPAGSTAPASNPALPVSAQLLPAMAEVADNTGAQQSLTGALPLPPPEPPRAAMMLASNAPASVAKASVATMRSSRVVTHRVSHSALRLADTQLAEALPPPKPFYAPRPQLERYSQSYPGAQENSTGRTVPMGAQVMSVKATAMAAPDASSAEGGSALGMASDLPLAQPMPVNGNGN